MPDTSPSLRDVFDARPVIAGYLERRLLRRFPSLDDLVGAKVWVKHENHQVTGAFKVRGGINLVSRLGSGDARERCEEVGAERGARYIHSGNEPLLIAGVGKA